MDSQMWYKAKNYLVFIKTFYDTVGATKEQYDNLYSLYTRYCFGERTNELYNEIMDLT